MRRLVVTADDFGASAEVNEGVERAHRDGILTAASLMVAGAAATDAVRRARALPRLGVGLHLVLVEGRPVLPPEQLSDLVGPDGCFRNDMAAAGLLMFASPRVRRQLAAEVEAQFQAFAATGLPLDHVNAHKHFHIHPTILSQVIATGRRYGARSIRAPVEPARLVSRLDGARRGVAERIASPWARLTARRLRRAGLAVPDQVFGLRWTGRVTADRLRALLPHLPTGLTEIYAHPATGAYPGSAPGYRYADELAALTDPGVVAALRDTGARPGRFADFTGD